MWFREPISRHGAPRTRSGTFKSVAAKAFFTSEGTFGTNGTTGHPFVPLPCNLLQLKYPLPLEAIKPNGRLYPFGEGEHRVIPHALADIFAGQLRLPQGILQKFPTALPFPATPRWKRLPEMPLRGLPVTITWEYSKDVATDPASPLYEKNYSSKPKTHMESEAFHCSWLRIILHIFHSGRNMQHYT